MNLIVSAYTKDVSELTQEIAFCIIPSCEDLAPMLGHLAARNAWCVAQLESPSHTHPHTLKHTHTQQAPPRQHTPMSRGRRRNGPHPYGRMVQIPLLIKKIKNLKVAKTKQLMSALLECPRLDSLQ